MAIGLTSAKLSLIEMSVLARWTIAAPFDGPPGRRERVHLGERKWQAASSGRSQAAARPEGHAGAVVKTTGNALWSSPLSYLEASTPGTGGWIETPNQRLGIRHVLPIKQAEELAQVTLDGASTNACAMWRLSLKTISR